MLKTAEPHSRDNFRRLGRPTFDPSPSWRVLLERVVNPILVIVGHVIPNQPSQIRIHIAYRLQRTGQSQRMGVTMELTS